MKTGEAIHRIQSLYSSGAKVDSSRLTDRYIYNMIKTARANVVAQVRNIGSWAYMSIGKADLITAPMAECGPSFGNRVYRTRNRIPTPLKSGSYLLTVYSVDGTVQFSQTTWENAKNLSSSRFARHTPHFYVRDRYLYFIGHQNIGTVVINGVFFDPVEAALYSGECVDAHDVDLGLDSELWNMVYNQIVEELGMFLEFPEDGTTDSADNPRK